MLPRCCDFVMVGSLPQGPCQGPTASDRCICVLMLFQWIAKHSLYVMCAGVFAGYFLPGWAAHVAPALPYSVGGMMVFAMVRISDTDLFRTLARWRLLCALAVWLLIASPVLMWLVITPLDLPPALTLALVLTAACPPLMSTVGLSWLLGLHPALALATVTVATLVCPVTLAVLFALGHVDGVNLDPLGLFLRLAALIGGTYALAATLRRVLGMRRIQALTPVWDIATVCMLLVFAIGVMDGVSARASAEPAFVLLLLGCAFALNLVMQLAGTLLARPLGASSALTVGFASGNRAVGILLAVSPADAGSDLVLFFALYQVPMYTLPSVLRPLYRWWAARQLAPG